MEYILKWANISIFSLSNFYFLKVKNLRNVHLRIKQLTFNAILYIFMHTHTHTRHVLNRLHPACLPQLTKNKKIIAGIEILKPCTILVSIQHPWRLREGVPSWINVHALPTHTHTHFPHTRAYTQIRAHTHNYAHTHTHTHMFTTNLLAK
jgi:hypothetical protein